MTKLTLETEHGTYSVELKKDDMDMSDVFEYLISPVLLAAGYD